jgi:hypothetical protein
MVIVDRRPERRLTGTFHAVDDAIKFRRRGIRAVAFIPIMIPNVGWKKRLEELRKTLFSDFSNDLMGILLAALYSMLKPIKLFADDARSTHHRTRSKLETAKVVAKLKRCGKTKKAKRKSGIPESKIWATVFFRIDRRDRRKTR